MPLYIIPEVPMEATEFPELLSRNQVELIRVQQLYNLYGAFERGDTVVAGIPTRQVGILMRYLEDLAPELPTVVQGVPGVPYPTDWNMNTATLHNIDYRELAYKLTQSGHTANTTKDASERSPASVVRKSEEAFVQRDLRGRSPQLKSEEIDDEFDT